MNQPLKAAEAKKRLKQILTNGVVTYAQPHAIDRLKERNISILDCENVLRAGKAQEAEWENGGWRHQIRTTRIVVVVEFLSEAEILVVTAWRL